MWCTLTLPLLPGPFWCRMVIPAVRVPSTGQIKLFNHLQYFSKGISPKVNAVVQPEFELAYYNVTVKYESHWVPLSYGLVPHLSKKLSKLPLHHRDFPLLNIMKKVIKIYHMVHQNRKKFIQEIYKDIVNLIWCIYILLKFLLHFYIYIYIYI